MSGLWWEIIFWSLISDSTYRRLPKTQVFKIQILNSRLYAFILRLLIMAPKKNKEASLLLHRQRNRTVNILPTLCLQLQPASKGWRSGNKLFFWAPRSLSPPPLASSLLTLQTLLFSVSKNGRSAFSLTVQDLHLWRFQYWAKKGPTKSAGTFSAYCAILALWTEFLGPMFKSQDHWPN